jgi:hypothetical protein
MKLPAFQFYPGDWRKDPGVQSLNYHDRGVWMEILCLMFESEHRGKLMLNGASMPDEALARLLGLDKQILTTTLTTLLTYGVASRDEGTGALTCRRMVRDEELRKVRSESGKMGGNPSLLKQIPTTGDKQSSTSRDNQIPTPSSSTSVDSHKGAVSTPSLADTFAAAEMSGVPRDVAETFWNEMESCGWIDRAQRPVHKWQSALKAYGNKWQANNHQRRQSTHQPPKERPRAQL